MATFRDPVECFAPLEMVERLLEIRADCGFPETLFLYDSGELADFLDAFGFDVYAFSNHEKAIDYGKYRAQFVPGGDTLHCSLTGH